MPLQTRIPRDRRGLLFKEGDYEKFLMPGTYFLMPGADLRLFDAGQIFIPPGELSIFLEDAALAAQLDIIEVRQSEIALVFEDGVCKTVLLPGRHAYWKGVRQRSFRVFDRSHPRLPDDLDRHALRVPAVLEQIQVFSVQPFEKAALFIDRKFVEILGPGDFVFWKSALSVDVTKVDMRIQHVEIPSQELLTKDRVTLRINFVFQYRVVDEMRVLTEVKDLQTQLYILFQLALREYVGNLTLDEILQKKEEIGPFVLDRVKPELVSLGLESSQAGVKDVILPGEIRDIMNQVLIAEKRAQANVITRREETASTRNLLNTAKLMEENPLLFRLKELEYMERLTEKVSEINVNGGSRLLDQLRSILLSGQ